MTKKLLSVVLNRNDIQKIDAETDGRIWYTIEGDTLSSYVSQDKLFFKLKDWAKKNKYYVWSGYEHEKFQGYSASIYNDSFYASGSDFITDSEYESVVLACEWILGELND